MAVAAAAAARPAQNIAARAREIVAFIGEERARSIAAGRGDPGVHWTYWEMRCWVYDYARNLKHPPSPPGEPERPMPDHVAGFLELLADTVHDDSHHDDLEGWNITAIVDAIRLVPGVSATTQPIRYLSKPAFAGIRARYAERFGCDGAGRPYCGSRDRDGRPYVAEKFNIFTIRTAVEIGGQSGQRASAAGPSPGRSGAVDRPEHVPHAARNGSETVRTPGGLRSGIAPDSEAGAESIQCVGASGQRPAGRSVRVA